MKSCRMGLETWTRKGKIPELLRHFSTGRDTREFFLQTSEYRSESCCVTRRSDPVWMYVVSMLTERISSFLQFGGRFSRDLELWQEGNKTPRCTMTCERCKEKSCLSGCSAACLTRRVTSHLAAAPLKRRPTNTWILRSFKTAYF